MTPEQERYFREVVLKHEGDECLLWPFVINCKGYGQMELDGRSRIVSRVVCIEINGPPPTPRHHAAHSCGKGDQACVSPKHVEWKTPSKNEADKIVHGTHSRGERQGASKITNPQAIEILALKGKMRASEIATKVGLSPSHVSRILRGQRWAWLQQGEPA